MQLKQHEIKSGMKARFKSTLQLFFLFQIKSIFSTVVLPRVLNEGLVVFSEISIDQVAVSKTTLIFCSIKPVDAEFKTTVNSDFHFSYETNL